MTVTGENNFAISYDPTETSGVVIPKRDYDAEITGVDGEWRTSEKGNRSKMISMKVLGATTEDGDDVILRSILTVGFYTNQKTGRRLPINFSTGWGALLKALGVITAFKLELDPALMSNGSQEDKERAYAEKLCAYLDTEVLRSIPGKTIRVAVDTETDSAEYGPRSVIKAFRAGTAVVAMLNQKFGNHASKQVQ